MNIVFDPEVLMNHPCSVLLLDDDADLVDSLRAFLGRQLACLGYTAPTLALERLANSGQDAAALSRFIGHYGDRPEDSNSDKADRLVLLRYSEVMRYAASPSRYDMISVVISDYSMPEMTGIDFFRKLKNSNVKKILLTGKADEKIAVEAFNEDIIDGFLLKQDQNIADKLGDMVLQLHRGYIRENSSILIEMLRASQENLFEEPEIADLMAEVKDIFDYIEYYFITEPRGFILRDAKGRAKTLRIESKKTLGEIADIFEDQFGPSPMSEAIRAAAVIPGNLGGPGWVYRLYEDFETHLVPCRVRGDWAWALTDFSPEDAVSRSTSWQSYRNQRQSDPINPPLSRPAA